MRDSFSEFVVRRPTYAAFEYQLRDAIPDNEARFKVAGEMLFYVEKDPRHNPALRADLETTLGKARSDNFFSAAHNIYRLNRLVLRALKILWFILFVLGVWSVGRVFLNWGWNSFVSLLAAAFVTGAVLELVKWTLLIFLASRTA